MITLGSHASSQSAADRHRPASTACTQPFKRVWSRPEVAWVVNELERRNLSHVVAQYFLHDDDAAASGAVEDSVRWLRENAPHITPQTNTL